MMVRDTGWMMAQFGIRVRVGWVKRVFERRPTAGRPRWVGAPPGLDPPYLANTFSFSRGNWKASATRVM